ncbi:MAG: DNA-binding protein [Planctomycetes bacterium]|nr:DNA-binding protein [Planctomycetota bacterium]
MAFCKEMTLQRCYMCRGAHGSDLLGEITDFCRDRGITLGRVEALGALVRARLGYYNQNTRQYETLDFDEHLEITNLAGNVSVKGGEPIVHAHVTLAGDRGIAYGGHLVPGCEIFACEFVVQEFDGPQLTRGLDEQTGLPLWNEE